RLGADRAAARVGADRGGEIDDEQLLPDHLRGGHDVEDDVLRDRADRRPTGAATRSIMDASSSISSASASASDMASILPAARGLRQLTAVHVLDARRAGSAQRNAPVHGV